MLEEIQITSNELIIGLVGAVGSSLIPLTNITKSLLEEKFKYEVEVIKVSKNILAKHFPEGHSFNNTFERISQFMDKGNELRFEDHDFIALQVTKEIHQRRQEWAKINSGKNTNQRRVAYIVDSLKHEDEIKALRQIYTNGFFQLSLYESKTARINSLVHEHGISEDKATQLIERDEGEKMLMDSIQERPFI